MCGGPRRPDDSARCASTGACRLARVDISGAPYTLFMLFEKLNAAKWTNWPADEVAAIPRFIDAWKRVLTAQARESEQGAWELDELGGAISAL